MYCLHCGDCCKTLSPFSEEPCKFLTEVKGFFFCSEYKNRPEQCKNHTYPYRFCLIGLDVLKLNDIDKIRERIDTGYELTITGGKDSQTPPHRGHEQPCVWLGNQTLPPSSVALWQGD
jgi:hypothetical protein